VTVPAKESATGGWDWHSYRASTHWEAELMQGCSTTTKRRDLSMLYNLPNLDIRVCFSMQSMNFKFVNSNRHRGETSLTWMTCSCFYEY